MDEDQLKQENGDESDDEIECKPMELVTSTKVFSAHLVIPFNSEREASIAHNSLVVDAPPKRSHSSKTFKVLGPELIIDFSAPSVRELRTSMNSFMDLLNLVYKTIDQFGPPVPLKKKICVDST